MWYELEGQKYTLTDIRRRHPDVLFPPGLFDPTPLGYTPTDAPAQVEPTPSYQDAWRALAEQYKADVEAMQTAYLTALISENVTRPGEIRAEMAAAKTQYRADQNALKAQYA